MNPKPERGDDELDHYADRGITKRCVGTEITLMMWKFQMACRMIPAWVAGRQTASSTLAADPKTVEPMSSVACA
jgi:hypothetical protein